MSQLTSPCHLRERGSRGNTDSEGHGDRGYSDDVVVVVPALRHEEELAEVGSEDRSAVGICGGGVRRGVSGYTREWVGYREFKW